MDSIDTLRHIAEDCLPIGAMKATMSSINDIDYYLTTANRWDTKREHVKALKILICVHIIIVAEQRNVRLPSSQGYSR